MYEFYTIIMRKIVAIFIFPAELQLDLSQESRRKVLSQTARMLFCYDAVLRVHHGTSIKGEGPTYCFN